MESKYFKVGGKVQGVYFRKTAKIEANKLNIKGWIRNDESGKFVEGEFYGAPAPCALFVKFLHTGSRNSKVDTVTLTPSANSYDIFEIRK
ncbi:Acylphosphatase [Spironucleus salmonicida]|uniref:acylphosphatase n=1 Tax=Spironucleus salmonicida TaxID=348837 RepID=V6LYC8_9EUKA|nr:Acylphosphatase [Spironucleus salmonicida]|eukprot:EST45809.1 Acylphosphatase [Spironucleus salmonicida]